MRKVLCSILLLVSVNTVTYNQLLKLPVLVEHFVEHRERDRTVGFLDFLFMHYWGHDNNDSDGDRDRQLPFKQLDERSITPVFCSSNRVPPIRTAVSFQKQDFPLAKDHRIPDPALASLFRPPRA